MPAGTTVGPYERWDGSPAALVGMVEQSSLPEHPELGKVMRVLQTMGYSVVYNIGMIIGLLPIFPAFYVLYNLDNWIYSGKRLHHTLVLGPDPGLALGSRAGLRLDGDRGGGALDAAAAHRGRPLLDFQQLLFP